VLTKTSAPVAFRGQVRDFASEGRRVQQLVRMSKRRASRHEEKARNWGRIYYWLAIPSNALATAAISLVKDYSKTLAAGLAGASAILTGLLALLGP
jgi:lipopolysaccharide export LptBFGC system permease protein LptF